MEIKSFIGYHGTCSKNVTQIKSDNFKPSKWGWTGSGVYFFESNCEMATLWAQYKYPDKEVCIFEASILVEIEKILDISNPNNEHSKKFHEVRKAFLSKLKLEGRKLTEREESIDCKIINMIAKKDGFYVVRNFTYTYVEEDRKLGSFSCRSPIRSNIANGIELCVKNLNCIDDMKVLEGVK